MTGGPPLDTGRTFEHAVQCTGAAEEDDDAEDAAAEGEELDCLDTGAIQPSVSEADAAAAADEGTDDAGIRAAGEEDAAAAAEGANALCLMRAATSGLSFAA